MVIIKKIWLYTQVIILYKYNIFEKYLHDYGIILDKTLMSIFNKAKIFLENAINSGIKINSKELTNIEIYYDNLSLLVKENTV